MNTGYKSMPGQSASIAQAPQGDPEIRTAKFYNDNQYWILDEVDKFLELNQREEQQDKGEENPGDEYGEEIDDQGLLAAIEEVQK